MHRIARGAAGFGSRMTAKQKQHYEDLAQGQEPVAFLLTCADSRIDPYAITGVKPGTLFTHRNVGNILPDTDKLESSETAASIEYAVVHLKVTDIIILGHTQCGAMTAKVQEADGHQDITPATRSWLQHANLAIEHCKEQLSDCTELSDKANLLARSNALLQVERAKKHMLTIAPDATLSYHAWIYNIKTGAIECYDEKAQQWMNLQSHPLASKTGLFSPQATTAQMAEATPAPAQGGSESPQKPTA